MTQVKGTRKKDLAKEKEPIDYEWNEARIGQILRKVASFYQRRVVFLERPQVFALIGSRLLKEDVCQSLVSQVCAEVNAGLVTIKIDISDTILHDAFVEMLQSGMIEPYTQLNEEKGRGRPRKMYRANPKSSEYIKDLAENWDLQLSRWQAADNVNVQAA